jgi:hypothetical protein
MKYSFYKWFLHNRKNLSGVFGKRAVWEVSNWSQQKVEMHCFLKSTVYVHMFLFSLDIPSISVYLPFYICNPPAYFLIFFHYQARPKNLELTLKKNPLINIFQLSPTKKWKIKTFLRPPNQFTKILWLRTHVFIKFYTLQVVERLINLAELNICVWEKVKCNDYNITTP